MGYTTDFEGSLKLSRAATEEEMNYINTFSGTRRMKRDVNKLMELYHGAHGNPFTNLIATPEVIYGEDGGYFAFDDGQSGQSHDSSIIDYNTAPGQLDFGLDNWGENDTKIRAGLCQPGLWCQWVITEDGTELEWDGSEKFYNYVEWLQYLITNFFEKWGINLNGEISWVGEDRDDTGKIVVEDNNIVVIDDGYCTLSPPSKTFFIFHQ
jgi:hypothetical protein